MSVPSHVKTSGQILIIFKWDYPGATVDKNLPANVGDTGSIPGLGRFHMLMEQLSLQVTTTEPQSQCSTAREASETRSLRNVTRE